MKKKEILQKILIGDKKISKYFFYPTGTGSSTEICSFDTFNKENFTTEDLLCLNLIEFYT